jgi:hypothetical protein
MVFPSVSVWGWVLGGLSAMVVGMIWYSPFLFGKQWGEALGVSEKQMNKDRAKVMPVLVAVSLLTAYVLSIFTVYFMRYTGKAAMMSGFDAAILAFVGFAGTALVAHDVFDPRPKSKMYINLGNRLVTLVVMGLIIGIFLK